MVWHSPWGCSDGGHDVPYLIGSGVGAGVVEVVPNEALNVGERLLLLLALL